LSPEPETGVDFLRGVRPGPRANAISSGVGPDHPDRAHALDPGQRAHLAAEPDPELRVVGQFGAQHLHRDLATVRGFGQVDDAHPARAQPGDQTVPPDLRRVRLPQRRASQRGCSFLAGKPTPACYPVPRRPPGPRTVIQATAIATS
jgi:hypothetical protein